jgi:hypothetical protein
VFDILGFIFVFPKTKIDAWIIFGKLTAVSRKATEMRWAKSLPFFVGRYPPPAEPPKTALEVKSTTAKPF